MDLQLYIKDKNTNDYIQLDLFNDEKVEINLNVKNLSDISKIRSDFSQPFTVPTSPSNNGVFQYWFDADVDGTFNSNIRVDAYIEVNSLPFRFGSVQLDNCKLKNGLPYSYSITFFGAGVNLSDKFGDDELKDLFQTITTYDHPYDSSVIDSINTTSLSNGDVYYPLISAKTYLRYGTNNDYDLNKSANIIEYKDFKPALRVIRIIQAIETKYNISFSRDFFDRAIFYNLFIWLHRDADRLKESSTPLLIDYTSLVVNRADWAVTTPEINLSSNSVSVNWATALLTNLYSFIQIKLIISTTSQTRYKIEIFDFGVLYETYDNLLGNFNVGFYLETLQSDNTNHLFTFKVSGIEGQISFTSTLVYTSRKVFSGSLVRILTATSTSQTTTNTIVKISEQIPNMKVKDFFNSLIVQFNLIVKPTGVDSYYIDTLDNWYSKGKAYDISSLVDIKDITVKRPSVKKKIDFLYQKTETVLGKQYFDNNQLSYGDLKAVYNITGDELKIESKFENMLFERLVDFSTSTTTDLQCGFAVDLTNNPVQTAPLLFYRNGFDTSGNIYIKTAITPSPVNATFTSTWHTATEDNIVLEQVTNSLNFGADNSSYFYQPITNSLYYNFWKTYIEELYNKKTRVLSLKCKLPIRILLNLGLNDRFIIGDYKYKISTVKVDLTNGDADIEIFSDLGAPIDSVNNINPLTVDSTDYTVDNDFITVDTVSVYDPVTSYTINGLSLTDYTATKGEENFEVKISANTNWSLVASAGWITPNKTSGNKSDYIRVKLSTNSGSTRTGTITVTIGVTAFTLNITQ
jgi:hypothetical protein